ncbi:MATE family efflux transporter [Aquabacterium sp.]|uniref:MATE family efflux transporter n=1 Tax=Aquabacterium sp. TaxID=1872578 RepID=UPI003784AF98
MRPGSFSSSVRRIAPLAWPVFVGQLAVLGFSTVDTVLVARHSATDLAALAVGSAAFVTVFIGLMGVVLAVGPIVGQLYGARRFEEAGHQLHQAIWLAIGLTLLGSLLLIFPAPFLALSKASPEVAGKVRGYLLALAFSLPASLLFTAYRGFNVAVSRPKAVMALQLGGLALKVPLSIGLISGVPALGVPALGVQGGGIATLIAMWLQVFVAWQVLRRDPFYQRFAIGGHGLKPPHVPSLMALLRLGVPMGLAILIEVTGFAFMAIFIARLGEIPVAGHQIAANLVALLFMMPLGLSNATSTLVAQRIGADDLRDARRLGWHGLQLTLAVALVMGGTVFLLRGAVVRLYTDNPAVVAAALPLVAWVALFHAADAVQTLSAFVLRAWRIATVPLVIYAVALWGVGLAGGYVLAFDSWQLAPLAWQGARGFWIAATAGLALAAAALAAFLLWMLKQQRQRHPGQALA